MANYSPSSGNVFKDMGLSSPNERLAKGRLAYKINCLITDQAMAQKDAADFLGISQWKMTALRNGRLKNFTIDYLASLFRRINSTLKKLQNE